jgi:hypothetical protein
MIELITNRPDGFIVPKIITDILVEINKKNTDKEYQLLISPVTEMEKTSVNMFLFDKETNAMKCFAIVLSIGPVDDFLEYKTDEDIPGYVFCIMFRILEINETTKAVTDSKLEKLIAYSKIAPDGFDEEEAISDGADHIFDFLMSGLIPSEKTMSTVEDIKKNAETIKVLENEGFDRKNTTLH